MRRTRAGAQPNPTAPWVCAGASVDEASVDEAPVDSASALLYHGASFVSLFGTWLRRLASGLWRSWRWAAPQRTWRRLRSLHAWLAATCSAVLTRLTLHMSRGAPRLGEVASWISHWTFMRLESAPPDLSADISAGIVEGFQFHIVSSIDAAHPSWWDDLCASADADAMLTRRFLRALEDAPPIAGATRYLLLTDPRDTDPREGGSATYSPTYSAAAVVTLLSFDLSLLAGPRARRVIGALRRIFPRLLHVRVAGCALSVSLGQCGLLIRPSVDERRALRAIDTLLRRLAAHARASLLAYQDLRPRDGARLAALAARGYGRLPNLPIHTARRAFATLRTTSASCAPTTARTCGGLSGDSARRVSRSSVWRIRRRSCATTTMRRIGSIWRWSPRRSINTRC